MKPTKLTKLILSIIPILILYWILLPNNYIKIFQIGKLLILTIVSIFLIYKIYKRIYEEN